MKKEGRNKGYVKSASSVAYTVYHMTTIVYITTVHERTKEWTK